MLNKLILPLILCVPFLFGCASQPEKAQSDVAPITSMELIAHIPNTSYCHKYNGMEYDKFLASRAEISELIEHRLVWKDGVWILHWAELEEVIEKSEGKQSTFVVRFNYAVQDGIIVGCVVETVKRQ